MDKAQWCFEAKMARLPRYENTRIIRVVEPIERAHFSTPANLNRESYLIPHFFCGGGL